MGKAVGNPEKTILVSDGSNAGENDKTAQPTQQPKVFGQAEEVMFGDVEGEVVITFQPGTMGIVANWVEGRVSDIVAGGQAEQLGVQIGWRFCRIGGEVYDLANVNKYAALMQPFTVRFFTSLVAAVPEVEEKQLENPIVTAT